MIIDAMDILYSNKVNGFCLVSSDSDFTRLATRLREAGMQVIGIGEKKTPSPFIVACDKFIYIEILKQVEEVDTKTTAAKGSKKTTPAIDTITKKDRSFMINTLGDVADDEGWAFLGAFGARLLQKRPNFDSRNYGFKKLSQLIIALDIFEIQKRSTASDKEATHMYVKVKD